MIFPVTQDMVHGEQTYTKGETPVNIQSFVIGDFPVRNAKGQVEMAVARLMSADDLNRSGFFWNDENNVVYTIRGRHDSPVGMIEYMFEEHERGISL